MIETLTRPQLDTSRNIELVGQHIRLKGFMPEDTQSIFALIDSNRNQPFFDDISKKYQTIETLEASIRNPNPRRFRFGIMSGIQLVGSVNIEIDEKNPTCAELGYYVGKDFSGKGFATKATQLLTSYAMCELGVNTVYANVDEQNLASQRVLEKAGFIRTNSHIHEGIPHFRYEFENTPKN